MSFRPPFLSPSSPQLIKSNERTVLTTTITQPYYALLSTEKKEDDQIERTTTHTHTHTHTLNARVPSEHIDTQAIHVLQYMTKLILVTR